MKYEDIVKARSALRRKQKGSHAEKIENQGTTTKDMPPSPSALQPRDKYCLVLYFLSYEVFTSTIPRQRISELVGRYLIRIFLPYFVEYR